MWQLDNRTPFKVHASLYTDKEGKQLWTVITKSTFSYNEEGKIELSENQEEVCIVPKFSGDPQDSRLIYDTDLSPEKPGTDIYLHGYAHVPGGRAKTNLNVCLEVGQIRKELTVWGDRIFENQMASVKPSEPIPFQKMEICYERAWGGSENNLSEKEQTVSHPNNPLGTGFASLNSDLLGRKVPNIEHFPPDSRKDRQHPAGFGPIPSHWHQRASLTGDFNDEWEKNRKPLLPKNFDVHYFHAAPTDQRSTGFLKGGEQVVLHNLTPTGNLTFRLPRYRIRCKSMLDNDIIEKRGELHTVILEPENHRLIMVWSSALPCSGKTHLLQKTSVTCQEET